MGDCIILLKVIGVTTYNGTSRSGRHDKRMNK